MMRGVLHTITYKENTLSPKIGTRTSGSSISTPILFLSMYLISAPALRTCVEYKRFTSHALKNYSQFTVTVLFPVNIKVKSKTLR